MLLHEKIGSSGGLLFRWRSYVILIFLPLLAIALSQGEAVERIAGDAAEEFYEIFCLALVLGGLALRAFTVGFVPARTSGRNTRGQAAQVLNTTGIYSLTRNPLYLGNCMVYLGVVMFAQNLLVALSFALFLVIYYERIIMAEEAFLVGRFGEAYREWAARVPAFFPLRFGWERPALPFSLRSVLRREYPGWISATLALFVIETAGDYFGDPGESPLESDWPVILAVVAAGCALLRLLKKRTRILDVAGR